MSSLDFSLAVLAAGCKFGPIDKGVAVQIEAGCRQPVGVAAQPLLVETLLGHGRVASGMYIFGLDGRDVAAVAGKGCVFGLDRVLRRKGSTLLWKWA